MPLDNGRRRLTMGVDRNQLKSMHQYIWRSDTRWPASEPARRHILRALGQAHQDGADELVFEPSCASCRPEFHWKLEGRYYSFEMPQDLEASEVKHH